MEDKQIVGISAADVATVRWKIRMLLLLLLLLLVVLMLMIVVAVVVIAEFGRVVGIRVGRRRRFLPDVVRT